VAQDRDQWEDFVSWWWTFGLHRWVWTNWAVLFVLRAPRGCWGVPVTVAKVCQFVFLRMRLAVQIRVRRLPVLQLLERCTLPSAASYSLGDLSIGEGCQVLCHFETWLPYEFICYLAVNTRVFITETNRLPLFVLTLKSRVQNSVFLCWRKWYIELRLCIEGRKVVRNWAHWMLLLCNGKFVLARLKVVTVRHISCPCLNASALKWKCSTFLYRWIRVLTCRCFCDLHCKRVWLCLAPHCITKERANARIVAFHRVKTVSWNSLESQRVELWPVSQLYPNPKLNQEPSERRKSVHPHFIWQLACVIARLYSPARLGRIRLTNRQEVVVDSCLIK
jgi:hypothetical protein